MGVLTYHVYTIYFMSNMILLYQAYVICHVTVRSAVLHAYLNPFTYTRTIPEEVEYLCCLLLSFNTWSDCRVVAHRCCQRWRIIRVIDRLGIIALGT